MSIVIAQDSQKIPTRNKRRKECQEILQDAEADTGDAVEDEEEAEEEVASTPTRNQVTRPTS